MSTIPDICTMHILLAAATTFEIQPTIDHFQGQVPVHITGVGGLSTGYSLMRQIRARRPDLILQAGIAGCFEPGKIHSVVAVSEEITGDLGVWEDGAFKTLFDLGFQNKDAFPFAAGRLVNPYTALLSFTGLPLVRAISVNEITTDKMRIGWYQQNMSPFVESMEGAALHYTCLEENIPFLQIRAVSNDIGERDKTKWDIKGSIHRLNRIISQLIEKIREQKDPALLTPVLTAL